ncbi:MAG TPA: PAS domain S-box protein, partial [Vicinamibacteria bacterium]|nr:PAS domain S-box protein [Vicinamibacteria bacterium]
MRILYLEDNTSDADLARREITRSNPQATVDVAPSLAEARRLLAAGAGYDVVLADLRLPDGNGLDLLHEIRGQGLPVAVVILTGAGGEDVAVAALKAGADDYIAKREGYVTRLPTTLETALGRFRAEVARRAGTLRVLYAEHHGADIALTQHHLETHAPHIRLEVVGDGRAALGRLPGDANQACPWDVLLLDYRLPGDSALEVLKIVREDRHLDVPVVLVTGQGDEEVATQALRLGATDYLVKNPNYLYALPAAIENAHHRVLLAREEAALRDSRARLASVVDSAMDAIISIDAEQRILLFNPAAEKLFGCSRDEAIGQHLERLMPERFRVNHRTHVQEFADTGATTRAMGRLGTLYGLRADGSEFPIEASISRAQVAGKSIYTVILRDVTERTESIERLRESEERFRQLTDRIEEVFWMTDFPKTTMLYVSPAYEKIWGRSCESLYTSPGDWMETVHPEDRARVREALTRQAEGAYDEEYRIVRPDGSLRVIHDRAFPVPDAVGNAYRVVGVAEDVTERKRAEEERSRLESQLRRSQKMEAIGRLAGGVAHDFNNMLGVILGYADMALRKLRPIDPIYKPLHEIRDAGQRSAELTRQLLAFSRQQPIAPQVLDLNAQLRGMERLLQRIIGEDVALEFALAPELWPVLMDRSQVDQAIANLAINSRDAMPDGGKLTVETANITADDAYCKRRPGSRPGDYVMLAVSDTGIGMDEATRERAFEPFFTTKPEGRGTGMGLATIYGVVRQNNGFADIYSEPGHGTTIRLYLPRSQKHGETSDHAAATDRSSPRGH